MVRTTLNELSWATAVRWIGTHIHPGRMDLIIERKPVLHSYATCI